MKSDLLSHRPISSKPHDISQELVNSNRPPTIIEEASVKASIQRTKLEIEENNKAIDDALALLRRLKARRHSLRDYLVSQQVILSPIRTLPAETLSEILTYFLSFQASESGQSGRNSILRLGQTCRRWRHLVLSTPKLWTFISLDLDSPMNESETTEIKTWLDRSGVSGLTVRLTGYCDGSQLVDSHSALSLLLSQSDRWVEVELTVSEKLIKHLNHIRGRVSMLSKLIISDADPDIQWESQLKAFEIAPMLRSFTQLTGALPIAVPYETLTTYKASACEPLHIIQTMRIAPDLTYFAAGVFEHDVHSSTPTFRHDQLRTLDISIISEFEGLFRTLSFPALQHLRITFRTAMGNMWLSRPEFTLFLRCMPCLQSLSINDEDGDQCITPEDLIACLAATTSIKELKLGRAACASLTDEVLTRLIHTPGESHTTLIPRVEVLSLHIPNHGAGEWDPDPFRDASFAAFVRSRNPPPNNQQDVAAQSLAQPVARLRDVTITFTKSYTADEMLYEIEETWVLLCSLREQGTSARLRRFNGAKFQV